MNVFILFYFIFFKKIIYLFFFVFIYHLSKSLLCFLFFRDGGISQFMVDRNCDLSSIAEVLRDSIEEFVEHLEDNDGPLFVFDDTNA